MGIILWFFGLKIRNVVSSGRNKNIVVFIGKPGVHTYIMSPVFLLWMFILKLKKRLQKVTNNNITDVFYSNTKTRERIICPTIKKVNLNTMLKEFSSYHFQFIFIFRSGHIDMYFTGLCYQITCNR